MEETTTQRDEELVHHDDAVIGRAIRWSLIALVLLAVIGGAVIYVMHRRPPAPPSKLTNIVPPANPERSASVPTAPFTDITAAAGIQFVHNNGAYGDKLLPETMGSGVAFFDYDGDGKPDLLFINSTWWPDHIPAGKAPTT